MRDRSNWRGGRPRSGRCCRVDAVNGGAAARFDDEALRDLDDAWRRACREDELVRRLPDPPAGSRLPELLTTAASAEPDDYADGVRGEAISLVQGDLPFDGAIRQFFLLGENVAALSPLVRGPALVRALNFGVEVIGGSYVGRAETAARTDELTTLPNERVLKEDIAGAIERVSSQGGRFALAALDLDGLKVANDEFGGHPAGDHYIRRFGAELLQTVREHHGRAYRVHGDEFFVIFRDEGRPEAEAVLADMHMRPEVAPFSFGVAACPDDATDFAGLMQIADRDRLYAMKQSRPRRAHEARAWLRSTHWDYEGGPNGRRPPTTTLARGRRLALDTFDRLCAWVASERRRRGT